MSLRPQSSSNMAGRLAAVPEERAASGVTAPSPPHNLYRDLIRRVAAVSGGRIRTIPTHNGPSSSASVPSDSSASKTTASSSDSFCAAATEFGAQEPTKIARRMISDGYTQRMALEYCGGSDGALQTWFFELDVDWVLQIPEGRDSRWQFQRRQERPAPSLHDLAKRWVRAFIIIAINIVEGTSVQSARFCKASIDKMLVFVDDAIASAQEENTLWWALPEMYICVSTAAYNLTFTLWSSPEDQHIFSEIGASLSRDGDKLNRAIYGKMEELWALMDEDDVWVLEIPRGRGEVHPSTRLIVDCIQSIVEPLRWAQNYGWYQDTANLGRLIDESVHYLKELVLKKSGLCSDPTLRYLFLLNNSYFVARHFEIHPGGNQGRLTPLCKKYMDSYLDVSWSPVLSHIPDVVLLEGSRDVPRRHVLFCIPKIIFHRPLRCLKNTSPLAKFDAAFHEAYQAQKFFKVPDPWLRAVLRRNITKRVISRYRDYLAYLKKHPELEKYVSRGCSSTNKLKEMLGELFEG